MKLKLQRTTEINNTVLGELFINNKFFCYTLEDKIRDVKIKHETCIPPGIYKVILTLSQRFKRILPLLLNVPNFDGIRIHAGNFNTDTSGCILVGSAINREVLLHSKTTLERLLFILTPTSKKEEITIEVINPIKEVSVVSIPEIISLPTIVPVSTIVQDAVPDITETKSNIIIILNQLLKWLIKYF